MGMGMEEKVLPKEVGGWGQYFILRPGGDSVPENY
jgi:hypothetical protein